MAQSSESLKVKTEMSKSVAIYVASHKAYKIDKEKVSVPIQVGAAIHQKIDGFIYDDGGDNISSLNPHFNELTATYWIWKNGNQDIVGLEHYRRRFINKSGKLLSQAQIETKLKSAAVIVPRKRRYYIETLESHYIHSHEQIGFDLLKREIAFSGESYSSAFVKVMRRTSGHMFNMLITDKKTFDEFCAWMFPILFRIHSDIDFSKLYGNETRVIGFLSEFMLDIWMEANEVSYEECRYRFLESQHWGRKIVGFLRNKYSKKKYLNTHIGN